MNSSHGFQAMVFIAGLLFVPARAYAACTPDPAPDGATVNCTATDTDGFSATNNNLRVNIDEIATVSSGSGSTIVLGDGNGILNDGTLNAPSGAGVVANNNNEMFLNFDTGYSGITNTPTGKITALIGIQVGSFNTVKNYGDINATNIGINVTGEGNFITNAGVISAGLGGQGIVATNGVGNDIRNSGTIVSAGDGIVVGLGNSINNTGTINASTILFGFGNAIVIATDSSEFGQQMIVSNNGTIKGNIQGGATDDTIFDNGMIQGVVALGDGADKLQLGNGGVLIGDVDGGDGVDMVAVAGHATFKGKVTNIETFGASGNDTSVDFSAGSTIGAASFGDGIVHLDGSVTTNISIASTAFVDGGIAVTGNVDNAGVLSPGSLIGTMNFSGNYTQEATGSLLVNLGTGAGDQLIVGGNAILDGSLDTALTADNLADLKGKTFTVLTAGSGISGTLENLGVSQQGFWTVDVSQTGNAVSVTVTDITVPIGATSASKGVLFRAVEAVAAKKAGEGGSGVVVSDGGNSLPILNSLSAGSGSEGINVTSRNNTADEQKVAALDYDSMGNWEAQAASLTDVQSLGERTPATAMPRTGTGTFEGTAKGQLTETGVPEAFVVQGNVVLTASFASGLVNADFTGMKKVALDGVMSDWIDFHARMSIADGTSQFAGDTSSNDGVWKGQSKGGFYGDAVDGPVHAAGLWTLASPLGRALGGFTANRQ